MTFANILPSDRSGVPVLARSDGRVEIGFREKAGLSSLEHLYQSGCGRVRFPTVDHKDIPEAVLINTAGGLTGGDQMFYSVGVGENTSLTVTGQAAEKIYKSIGPDVTIEADLTVRDKGYLEWLPQETILFEKSRLRRLNKVAMTSNSTLLAVEATILGRRAHGETLSDVNLSDGWKIWRDEKLVWFDQFRLQGNLDDYLQRRAILNGATAFATVVLVTPEKAGYLELARATADGCESTIGVTEFDEGIVIIRLLDRQAYSLRQSLVKLLIRLRNELAGEDVPMPAVWEV